MTPQAEHAESVRFRNGASGGSRAAHRYLLITTEPQALSELVSSLCSQPAEVTISFPEGADRHRVLALRPDVVLLHVGSTPKLQELLEELRGWRSVSPTPVLAFVGHHELEAHVMPPGIDDFVVEPWDASEVLARLHRSVADRRGSSPADVLEAGPLSLDVRQRTCLVEGKPVELTFIEFEMLKALVSQPNRFLGPAELLRTVWDGRHPVRLVTLRVWIKRLRDKLPPEHRARIETRRSVGYRFVLENAILAAAG
jgi:two-component system response regulator MtrA